MRYSAHGLSLDDFSEGDLRVKSGAYRGYEKLLRTKVSLESSVSDLESGSYPALRYLPNYFKSKGSPLKIGEHYSVINKATKAVFSSKDYPAFFNAGSSAPDHVYFPRSWGGAIDIYIVASLFDSVPVAEEYTHVDVIGEPANILQCNALKDGWIGTWIPQLVPDYTTQSLALSKPAVNVTSGLFTPDKGVTWSSWSVVFDSIRNTVNAGGGATSSQNIYLVNYKTKTNPTKDANNSDVWGGELGIGKVWVTCWGDMVRGRQFAYSLINKVLTASNTYLRERLYPLVAGGLSPYDNKLPASGSYPIKHTTLDMPTIDSPAIKALSYYTVKDGQAFINYAYTELKNNGVDWGDDGQINIVNGKSTMVDDNGNTVIVGTAQIVEPLGWIKNDQ